MAVDVRVGGERCAKDIMYGMKVAEMCKSSILTYGPGSIW